jgi:hypothetical protein
VKGVNATGNNSIVGDRVFESIVGAADCVGISVAFDGAKDVVGSGEMVGVRVVLGLFVIVGEGVREGSNVGVVVGTDVNVGGRVGVDEGEIDSPKEGDGVMSN